MDGHDLVQVKNGDVGPRRASSAEFQSASESDAAQHHAQPARSFVEDDKHFFHTLAEQLNSPLDAQGRTTFHNQHPGVSTATVKASSAGLILPSKPSSAPRSEHPYFPNQAYSALHDQIYPSQSLRTGRPKHQSSYSVVSSSASMSDHPYVELGSRTAGNSPSTTPALFTPTTTSPGSPAYSSADVGDDGSYASPYLHFMQRQAPKETHIADVDVDPISGRKLINQYEIIDELGRGVHGKVKLGRNLTSGEYVAIKIVDRFARKRRLGRTGNPADKIKREIAILKKARHPNIVGLLEVIDDPAKKKVYIVLEHVEMGEVRWRTEGSEEIVSVEYRRFERECHGIFDDTAAGLEDDKILEDAFQRRRKREMHHLRYIQRQSVPEETEPWSFEHGGGIENDASDADQGPHKSVSASASELSFGDIRRSEGGKSPFREISATTAGPSPPILEQTSTAHPVSDENLPPYPHNEIQHPQGACADEARAAYSTGLEGTMYGPYDSETPHGRTPSVISMSMSHANSTSMDEIPEHFHHVPLMTLSAARSVFRDTVLGLEYLHYQGVIHRDIKPANLLQTKDHRVKISDFGVSYLGRQTKQMNPDDPSESDVQDLDEALELAKTVGTPAFYAPELCQTDCEAESLPVTGQIDVWALGVTLYCLVYGRVPYHDFNTFVLMRKIAEDDIYIPRVRLRAVESSGNSGTSSRARAYAPANNNKRSPHELAYENVDDDLHDLIKRLFIKDPRKRITIREVKRHPWVLRDISNPVAWVEETDPSRLTEGKRIEVSNEDVADAVVPLNIIERVRSGIRKLGGAFRLGKSSGSRARAQSAATSTETLSEAGYSTGNPISPEARRPSLRGDESILTALKASRESEHPLSQSQTASPSTKERSEFMQSPPSRSTSPRSTTSRDDILETAVFSRPVMPERAYSSMSTAASIRTIRQSDISRDRSELSPDVSQGLPGTPVALEPLGGNSLGGIFGGAGRRILKSVRSRDKSLHARPKQTRATTSNDAVAVSDVDPHGEPSIGFSNTLAAGHLNPPVALRERSPISSAVTSPASSAAPSVASAEQAQPDKRESEMSRNSSAASVVSSNPPTDGAGDLDTDRMHSLATKRWQTESSSDERFHRAQDELIRKQILEQSQSQDREASMASRLQLPTTLSHGSCPPSPDDDIFVRQREVTHPSPATNQQSVTSEASSPTQVSHWQQQHFVSSSSSDHFTSGMSQSTSNPSIPSVVSANSSVLPDEGFGYVPDTESKHSSDVTLDPTPKPADEDDDGYAGDHAAETETDGDDSGSGGSFIEMTRHKPSVHGRSASNASTPKKTRSRRRPREATGGPSSDAPKENQGSLQPTSSQAEGGGTSATGSLCAPTNHDTPFS